MVKKKNSQKSSNNALSLEIRLNHSLLLNTTIFPNISFLCSLVSSSQLLYVLTSCCTLLCILCMIRILKFIFQSLSFTVIPNACRPAKRKKKKRMATATAKNPPVNKTPQSLSDVSKKK